MPNAQELYQAVNQLRADPQLALQEIKTQLNRFETPHVYRNKAEQKVRALSGKAAWQDCILVLERQKKKSKLQWSPELAEAAEAYRQLRPKGQKLVDVLKNHCETQGAVSHFVHSLASGDTPFESVAQMLVGDADERKTARIALFHPLHRLIGINIQGNVIEVILADNVLPASIQKGSANSVQSASRSGQFGQGPPSQDYSGDRVVSRQSSSSGSSGQGFGHSPHIDPYSFKNPVDIWEEGLRIGKQVLIELNKVRKDPKQAVHAIKTHMERFNEDNTLKTEQGNIPTKEGKGCFEELISDLQQMYPLPSVKEVTGLATTALEQAKPQIDNSFPRMEFEQILAKHCTEIEGVRSLKVRSAGKDPVVLLLTLLGGDGDKKRTVRRKLLSPVCKVIGCWVCADLTIINAGDAAKDKVRPKQPEQSKPQEHASYSFNSPMSPNRPPSNQSKQSEGRVTKGGLVVRKISRSRFETRQGRQYKVTETELTFEDGHQQIIEEQILIDS